MMLSIILACMVAVVSGCEPLVAPKYGSMDCIEGIDVTRCNFTCEDGTDMFGAKLLTCLPSGKWDNIYPYCEPDYSICGPYQKGAPKCPPITEEDRLNFERFLNLLTERLKNEMDQITMEMISLISHVHNKSEICIESLCNFPCIAYPEYVARECRTCRQKRLIRCPKLSTYFNILD
uniref:Sushi domain-containing protein n=1 Tax=Ciona savignyi TaxID=51511 RepID=H2ZR12_CIOSA